MEYKVILFDADDTLFDFQKTEKHALENLMCSLDTVHDKDYCINIYREINTKIWKEFEEGKLTLEDVYAYGKEVGEPKQTSGKQELYEAILNMYC